MANDVLVPFGYNSEGDIVFVQDLDLQEQYGAKCELVCPECGSPLVARRDLQNRTDNSGWLCLAHAPNTSPDCCGYGESSSHRLAKEIFQRAIGRQFVLPSTGMIDSHPHISRYADSGKVRPIFNNSFDIGGQPTPLRFYNPYVNSDDEHDDFLISQGYNPRANECFYGQQEYPASPNIELSSPRALTISKVESEVTLENGLIADIVLTLKINDKEQKLPIEIRYTHPKSQEDVERYSNISQSVVEIYIADILPNDKNFLSLMTKRLLGDIEANSFFNNSYREWLYNSTLLPKIRKSYKLDWVVEDEDCETFVQNELSKKGYNPEHANLSSYNNFNRCAIIFKDRVWQGYSRRNGFIKGDVKIYIIEEQNKYMKNSIQNFKQLHDDIYDAIRYKVNIDKKRNGYKYR